MTNITLSINDEVYNSERIMTMLASEEVLKKDWFNDLDERWNNL